MENGTFAYGLGDERYQKALGEIAASYEHLEGAMPYVLAALMGTADDTAAGYVYRTIRNPRTRSDLMWRLLESAPHNANAPEWFDDILRAHDSIRKRRNDYMHGIWSLRTDDRSTFLAVFPEHGPYMPSEARREPLENLTGLVEETKQLTLRVHREIRPHLARLRKQQQAQALIDAQRQTERERRRARAKQPPPPGSSKATGDSDPSE